MTTRHPGGTTKKSSSQSPLTNLRINERSPCNFSNCHPSDGGFLTSSALKTVVSFHTHLDKSEPPVSPAFLVEFLDKDTYRSLRRICR